MTAQGASPGVGVARLKSPEGATQMDRPLVGLEPTQVEPLAFKARVVQSVPEIELLAIINASNRT
jgi:hypothetical protein